MSRAAHQFDSPAPPLARATANDTAPVSQGAAVSQEAAVTASDAVFMHLALEHGRKGTPAPNPHVGAVVVLEGELVGVGHHERAGEAHAEALALRHAGARARGATLYVTLEPCNHHGRTPPCVDAILASGVTRVVVGCADPNPHVKGGGATALRRAGIEVVYGEPWREEAETLIAAWRSTIAR